MSEKTINWLIKASLEYEDAKRDLVEAERQFTKAVNAARVLGLHLSPELMSGAGIADDEV